MKTVCKGGGCVVNFSFNLLDIIYNVHVRN